MGGALLLSVYIQVGGARDCRRIRLPLKVSGVRGAGLTGNGSGHAPDEGSIPRGGGRQKNKLAWTAEHRLSAEGPDSPA